MRNWAKTSLGAGIYLLIEAATGQVAVQAQVAGDGSWGSLVNGDLSAPCTSDVCTVTGGTVTSAGDTLLHSLQTFSLNTANQSVRFVDPGVSDIVVRVTGGTESLLNGTIQASDGSTANLFIINPEGIQFGPTARLDVGGSFFASTASQIDFGAQQVQTGEATPVTDALLTVSAPVGLGFLSEGPTRPSSGSIRVQGPGNLLTFGSPESSAAFVNRVFQQQQPAPGLAVRPGNTLALMGRGVELTGGLLAATGGQIELGSVQSGQVRLGAVQGDYSRVEEFGPVSLDDRALLEVSGDRPGRVIVRGDDIAILESAAILAETLRSSGIGSPPSASPRQPASPPVGEIDIAATGTMTVSGFSLEPTRPPFHSYLSVDVAPGASGAGGQIALQANRLRIDDGGQIGANTYGPGSAGQVQINVTEELSASGGSPLGPSGLFAISDSVVGSVPAAPGSGNGGTLAISAGQLRLEDGAQLLTTSFSQGTSGNIAIAANEVSLQGTSLPFLPPRPDLQPPGMPPGPPPGMPPSPPLSPTLIQSGMGPIAQDEGGSVSIETQQLTIRDGAEISTGTFGAGNAGDLSISAQDVTIAGFSPETGPSGLLTTVGVGATGAGGTLSLATDRLQVLNGAQVSTSTLGPGPAGDLQVRGENVFVSGQTPLGRSGLFATAIGERGAGGNLQVQVDRLSVENGGTLSVSNFPSSPSSPIPPGQGAAGNLQVQAAQVVLRDRALLSADTAAGDRGNIRLETGVLALREASRITTNASGSATGGNINIVADDGFVLAVPAENSDITANAVQGDGGQVTISAQNIFGIEARPQLTEQSDITASSEFGVDGETRVETVDTEIRPQPQSLPNLTEVSAVVQGCAPGGTQTGRFVQSGRGGAIAAPYGVLESYESITDVSVPGSLLPQATSGDNPTEPILEAQGWQLNAHGDITLVTAETSIAQSRCVSWQQ